MNGVHDMGGMANLGPIAPEAEADEPVFHHAWEGRVHALEKTAPLLGYYAQRCLLHRIDSSRAPDVVFHEISAILEA